MRSPTVTADNNAAMVGQERSMAQRKSVDKDTRTQRQKFIDAAREHGADADNDAFKRALTAVAKAPRVKAKKAAKKRKR